MVEEAVVENMKEYIHEAFLAGTTVEITPITSLGDFVIRDGQPGPVTRLIQEKFYALVASGKANKIFQYAQCPELCPQRSILPTFKYHPTISLFYCWPGY